MPIFIMPKMFEIATVICGTVFTVQQKEQLRFTVRYNWNNLNSKRKYKTLPFNSGIIFRHSDRRIP